MTKAISAVILLAFTAPCHTRSRVADYAVVLADAPVARKVSGAGLLACLSSRAGREVCPTAHLQSIRQAQSRVLAELSRRNVRVVATQQILVNAIFVSATREAAVQLKSIPGVIFVQYLPPVRRDLNAAMNLVHAPDAWSAVGGAANAGAGI